MTYLEAFREIYRRYGDTPEMTELRFKFAQSKVPLGEDKLNWEIKPGCEEAFIQDMLGIFDQMNKMPPSAIQSLANAVDAKAAQLSKNN